MGGGLDWKWRVQLEFEKWKVGRMRAVERFMYYGPTQSCIFEIERGLLAPGDFVRYNRRWAKVRETRDTSLVTEDGKTVNFKSPGADFKYQKPSELGNVMIGLTVALVVGFMAAGATVWGAIYMVRNTPATPPCPACPACPAPPAPSGPVIVQ